MHCAYPYGEPRFPVFRKHVCAGFSQQRCTMQDRPYARCVHGGGGGMGGVGGSRGSGGGLGGEGGRGHPSCSSQSLQLASRQVSAVHQVAHRRGLAPWLSSTSDLRPQPCSLPQVWHCGSLQIHSLHQSSQPPTKVREAQKASDHHAMRMPRYCTPDVHLPHSRYHGRAVP